MIEIMQKLGVFIGPYVVYPPFIMAFLVFVIIPLSIRSIVNEFAKVLKIFNIDLTKEDKKTCRRFLTSIASMLGKVFILFLLAYFSFHFRF